MELDQIFPTPFWSRNWAVRANSQMKEMLRDISLDLQFEEADSGKEEGVSTDTVRRARCFPASHESRQRNK